MKSVILIVLSFLLFKSNYSQSNKFKNKVRSGTWVVYYDSLKTKVYSRGKYVQGRQKGKWTYYDTEGNLTKREIYRRKRIKVKMFRPGNKLERAGQARLILNDTLYHYYFVGKWKCYNKKGELEKLQYFERGNLLREQILKTSETPLYNDSLVMEIKRLYRLYYQLTDSARYIYTNYGSGTAQYLRMKGLEARNDSIVKAGIESITTKFGYPSKEMVGEESPTLFFLISSYDQEMKEKYYELIMDASDKNILDKKDVSFFIDKVCVGRKEPQVYCTQFKFSQNYKMLYYPVKDIETLNDRRSAVGLDTINISELTFLKYE